MRHLTISLICAAYFALAIASPCMAQTIQSTFNVDAEGWTIVGELTSTLVHSTTGGNPGGRIILNDGGLGGSEFFVAPAQFLGNISPFYNGTLSFDLLPNQPTSFFGDPVSLTGGGNTLTHLIGPFPAGSYATTLLTLNEASGWSYNGGGAPSQAQFLAVLENVSSLQIPGDFSFTPSESVSLDNVSLTVAVPEPSSLLMLGATGAIGLGVYWKRRRKLAVQ